MALDTGVILVVGYGQTDICSFHPLDNPKGTYYRIIK